MRVVFLGTPDFAVKSLDALYSSRHEIAAVVTQPDKPTGRKAILTSSPVKARALELGLKVLQYDKISVGGADDLRALNADIMVTCAFGQILSGEIIGIAPRGVINVHASLLPKYRGAAPIQYAVINGDTETGVTIMQTEVSLDSGDILAVEKVAIGESETAGELFSKLSEVGAKLLVDTLDRLERGEIVPVPQDHDKATFVKPIRKADALIDWSLPAKKIFDLIRGMNPWPVAFTYLNGKLLKIYSAEIAGDVVCGEAGSALVSGGELFVKCGKLSLKITSLQAEGGKKMAARDFLLGRKISSGDVLKND